MNAKSSENSGDQYQVVALRYRPQAFGDLVGQGHIATALSNAIDQCRVGHAYLFTGARGVGKTSSARIFAKCLNCETGPTKTPCNECDICQSVSSGEDVDVLEIDGASNRGIDEIRQLRSNAAVRPSRSRHKIYIIDEVHMLTTQAFNALLKTLEEPPKHVKFIFCTTDPQKIPITVLSRCQRFDFSPVQTNEIANRLREIATAEGVTADEEALALLARRANGSMRDSQSLLEQLFSFCGEVISVDEVHQLLGTADIGRIAAVATALAESNPSEALNLIHKGVLEGVDSGQMAEQLLGYFRDMMAARVGCEEETLLNCTSSDVEQLNSLAETLGLETILMIVQLLDAAVVRMQTSLHGRTLLEVAAIRICNLEKLESISDLVQSLSKGGGAAKVSRATAPRRPRVPMQKVNSGKSKSEEQKTPVKKNDAKEKMTTNGEVASAAVGAALVPAAGAASGGEAAQAKVDVPKTSETSSVVVAQSQPLGNAVDSQGSVDADSQAEIDTTNQGSNSPAKESSESTGPGGLTASNLNTVWDQVIDRLTDMTSDMVASYEKLELKESDLLVVTLENRVSKDLCSKPDKKETIESVLRDVTGQTVRVDFQASTKTAKISAPAPKMSRAQQIRKLHEDEFVKQAMSLFDAEITGYKEPMPTRKA
jgi:DNA polymerase-3 subunit gamma/tau